MRTTVDLDEDLLREAQEYAPRMTKTALLEEGLRVLVQREACRRLARMGGSQPDLALPPRRKGS